MDGTKVSTQGSGCWRVVGAGERGWAHAAPLEAEGCGSDSKATSGPPSHWLCGTEPPRIPLAPSCYNFTGSTAAGLCAGDPEDAVGRDRGAHAERWG